MCVNVDTARDHKEILRVEQRARIVRRKVAGDGGNAAAGDANVARVRVAGSDDCALSNDRVELHCIPPVRRCSSGWLRILG